MGDAIPPPSHGDQLPPRFASFNAAAYEDAERRLKARHAAELLAAADALLPSSSEEESTDDDKELSSSGRGIGRPRSASPLAHRGPQPTDMQRRGHVHSNEGKEKKEKKKRKRKEDDRLERRQRTSEHKRETKEGIKKGHEREPGTLAVAIGSANRTSRHRMTDAKTLGIKECFLDTHGDAQNVTFGGLYRGDVARYRRYDPGGAAASMLHGNKPRVLSAGNTAASRGVNLGRKPQKTAASDGVFAFSRRRVPTASAVLPIDVASSCFMPLDPALDSQPGEELPRHHQRQRTAGKTGLPKAALNEDEEIPGEAETPLAEDGAAETAEEYLLRRTREFNAALRERPEDLRLWLDYASFQDDVPKFLPRRRGAIRGLIEKKVSILEAALKHHPSSEKLLLALLQAAEAVCEPEEVERRWRGVLAAHSHSARLWRSYLQKRRSDYSTFRSTDVAQAHHAAVSALYRQRETLLMTETGTLEADLSPKSSAKIAVDTIAVDTIERQLVAALVAAAALQFRVGNTEAGVAAVQTMLEMNFFSPAGWPEDALKPMYESFWCSGGGGRRGAPALGEEGASGWGNWVTGDALLAGQEVSPRDTVDRRQTAEAARNAAQPNIGDGGSAFGRPRLDEKKDENLEETGVWVELAPAIRARFGHALRFDDGEAVSDHLGNVPGTQTAAVQGDDDTNDNANAATHAGERSEEVSALREGSCEDDIDSKENEEKLLARLGLEFDRAVEEAQTLTPELVKTWLEWEREREARGGIPRRRSEHDARGDQDEDEDVDVEVQAMGGIEPEDGSSQQDEERSLKECLSVTWRDVEPFVVTLRSAQARNELLGGCLRLLGCPGTEALLPARSPVSEALTELCDDFSTGSWWLGIAAMQYHDTNTFTFDRPATAATREREQQPWWALSMRRNPVEGPWWAADEKRQQFLLRILVAFVCGPAHDSMALACAALEVASWKFPSMDDGIASPVRDYKAGKQLAKRLLAEHKDNLWIWAAYVRLQARAGAVNAAKKAASLCLVSAPRDAVDPGNPAVAALALCLANLELAGAAAPVQDREPLSAVLSPAWHVAPAPEPPLPLRTLLCATRETAAAAARPLVWLGTRGKFGSASGGGPSHEGVAEEAAAAARRGFQDSLLKLVTTYDTSQQFDSSLSIVDEPRFNSSVISAAAACEMLLQALYKGASSGVVAALGMYDQVLAAMRCGRNASQSVGIREAEGNPQVNGDSGGFCHVIERVQLERCSLAVSAAILGVHGASPKQARESLLEALEKRPSSPEALHLLRALEMASHNYGLLRRTLNVYVGQQPSMVVWAMLVGLEMSARSPTSAVQSVLERTVADELGRHCALLWRVYVWFLKSCGRGEAARRVVLRGLDACPWSKALWLDGFEALRGVADPRELTDLLRVMKRQKEMIVRTDVLEVSLGRLNDGVSAMID